MRPTYRNQAAAQSIGNFLAKNTVETIDLKAQDRRDHSMFAEKEAFRFLDFDTKISKEEYRGGKAGVLPKKVATRHFLHERKQRYNNQYYYLHFIDSPAKRGVKKIFEEAKIFGSSFSHCTFTDIDFSTLTREDFRSLKFTNCLFEGIIKFPKDFDLNEEKKIHGFEKLFNKCTYGLDSSLNSVNVSGSLEPTTLLITTPTAAAATTVTPTSAIGVEVGVSVSAAARAAGF